MLNISKKQNSKGFTLLEILLVIGIIAILAGIVIIAINPGRQLGTARNAERRSDIKQVYSAMSQFYIDHAFYPASTTLSTTTLTEICATGDRPGPQAEGDDPITCTDMIDLSELVPTYITSIPADSRATTTDGTGYNLMRNSNQKLILTAPEAENGVVIAIGTSTAATTTASTLGDGLIAHYKMNDANCTTVDDTQGNDGAGTCTSDPSGVVGTALAFNGSGNNITLPALQLMNMATVTMAFWVKTTANSGANGIISCEDGPQYSSFWLYVYSGLVELNWDNANGGPVLDSDSVVNDGVWHHVVIKKDGNDFSIYVDGVDEADETNAVSVRTTAYLTIGSAYTGTMLFPGSLDDFRIYNRVLTQGEIDELVVGTEAE